MSYSWYVGLADHLALLEPGDGYITVSQIESCGVSGSLYSPLISWPTPFPVVKIPQDNSPPVHIPFVYLPENSWTKHAAMKQNINPICQCHCLLTTHFHTLLFVFPFCFCPTFVFVLLFHLSSRVMDGWESHVLTCKLTVQQATATIKVKKWKSNLK